ASPSTNRSDQVKPNRGSSMVLSRSAVCSAASRSANRRISNVPTAVEPLFIDFDNSCRAEVHCPPDVVLDGRGRPFGKQDNGAGVIVLIEHVGRRHHALPGSDAFVLVDDHFHRYSPPQRPPMSAVTRQVRNSGDEASSWATSAFAGAILGSAIQAR